MNNPLAFVFRLLIILVLIICCFPIAAVIFIVLWLTGRLGLARSFIYTASPLRNRAPEPERAVPHCDDDTMENGFVSAPEPSPRRCADGRGNGLRNAVAASCALSGASRQIE